MHYLCVKHTEGRTMEKVVILARVSTDKQEYQRQVKELTDYCNRVGWSVDASFCNKVSGAKTIEERAEIQDLIAYVKTHEISRVVCLEISRLGRNTFEALRVIQSLNENGVSLFVKNYGIETLTEGKVNPVASLICTILLEVASMERLTIKERMASGRDQYNQHYRKPCWFLLPSQSRSQIQVTWFDFPRKNRI